jgi:uncharacterized LabA/DUF88 family protein
MMLNEGVLQEVPNYSRKLEMTLTYMFIDGGFLRAVTQAASEAYRIDAAASFDYAQLTKPYHRTFYYDSPPAQKSGQSQEEFEQARSKMETLFRRIGSTPNVHVKTGSSRFRKGRGTEQKAVDILLALDVYRHAVNGNMDTAIIVTSDADFEPVLDSLQETRVRSILWCNPANASQPLQDAADLVEAFNEQNVMRYMPDPAKYAVGMGSDRDNKFRSQMPLVTKTSGTDWRFSVYFYKERRQYIGVFDGRKNPNFASLDDGQLRIITSPDFRSIKFFCEGRYKLSLSELKAPSILNLDD